jgi:nicotinate-nucleotide pyrophosphorylase (carboxylating)
MKIDLDKNRIDTIIRFALKEDIRTGDITSEAVIDELFEIDAVILSRSQGVVCGMDIIERVFSCVDPNLRFRPLVKDGDTVEPDQEIAFIEGEAHSIMRAERTALNFLSMLSGVSTTTKKIVDLVKDTGVKIFDTRKTIPLHRYLEKYAVFMGGGCNHRKGLWDMVLIKDNHIRIFAMQSGKLKNTDIVKDIIKRAKKNTQKNVRIEIEVETLKECEKALEEKPNVIMLDNMPTDMITKAVKMRKDKGLEKDVILEVSGGITEKTVKEYAETGIDVISIGAITGAIKPIDFSLEIIFRDGKLPTSH